MEKRIPFIPRDEFEARQETARKRTREAGLDGIIVIGGPFYDRPGDLAYLTGHYPPFPSVNFHGEFRGLGFGIFVLPVSGGASLITDTQAYRAEFVVSDEIRATKNLPATFRESLRDMGLASANLGIVGLEVAPWTFITEMGIPDIRPADSILRRMRRSKSRNEIDLLRGAAEVAEIGIAAAQAAVAPGRTEGEICGEGVRASLAAGADFVRCLRVLSGPYGGLPHRWPPSTERIMREGETVCMDFIGAVKGYQFDILRTSFIGSPSAESRRLVERAETATEAAIAACGPGVPVREVIRAADDVIGRGGYLEWRAKFTGHGIGLDTVEAPFLMAESDEVLEVGDTVCLEPGILIRDVQGARFEYEVVITEAGCERLASPLRSPGG